MERLLKMNAYRNRAEELRTMVADFRDEEPKRMLDRLADDYDRMADNVAAEIGAHFNRNSLRHWPG
jgi:hypothetical protein